MTPPKSKGHEHSECCDVMDLALERQPSSQYQRFGLVREMAFNIRTGAESYPTIIRFANGKKGTSYPQHRDATYAEVSYCPFCGKKQRRVKGKP